MAEAAREYKGHDGVVRIEGDELVWIKGGRVSRSLGVVEWRVPLASVRDVLFKDSKMTGGYLHLVIGDAVAPKDSSWGVTGHQWTLAFQPGRQAKAIREVHDYVQRAIAYNRQTGVDPTKARLPYLAEEDQRQPSEPAIQELVRQPSPSSPVSQLIALAKQQPKAFSETWASLDTLPERLQPGELVRLLAATPLVTGFGILALTDRRVLVHRNDSLGQHHDEVALRAVESVAWKPGVLGGLVIRSAAREIKLGVSEPTARAFIDGIGAERAGASPGAPDVMDQLRKLGELRDGGVLTEDEFQAKKADLLSRM